ncbi:hypothetical protein PIB30_027342 [Stylosanthes scabra]|uniref:Uncharacterized protein n=1 Tax=Stylosanthes scabra TaxID=79078 RepID=A0ABU6RAZ0_9FABA|nr:hypothetical protein [Stylosanthes scabra]
MYVHLAVCKPSSPNQEASVDVREEYANAFRTESYVEFWTRVLAYPEAQNSFSCLSRGSTTSARLPSYRLFAEHLLDPDQPTVIRALNKAQHWPTIHSFLSEYFAHTTNASLLCSHLLKDIDCVRVKYQSLKTILQCLANNHNQPPHTLSLMMTQLTEFSNSLNPFSQSSPSPGLLRAAQCECSELQKRLESSRDKMRGNLQLMAGLKRGSACLLVAITASLIVIVISHGLVLLVATPGLVGIMELVKMDSENKLRKVIAEVDAAAKGTYIVNKDLETTSRLVARLNNELEYMRTTVKFWLERKDEKIQADGEVVRLLKQNQCSFSDLLDDLEEHLYLCFMTINRARHLVLKNIIQLTSPSTTNNLS